MIRSLAAMSFALAAGTAQAQAPRVVTDIAPVHSLVARVMQGVGSPEVLLPAGASPHDHALRPSEARLLSDASLVIWVGPGLTPWLEAPLEALAPAAARLVLSDDGQLTALPIREGGAFGEHGPEEGDEHDDHDVHDEHEDHREESSIDPHLWLDPENGQLWLEAIARALSALDPENAEAYVSNALAGAVEIAGQVARISAQMGAAPRPYLAYHDAFQYAEAWLGLVGVGAIESGHAVELGPARLAQLRDVVSELGVTCILAEPQFNPGLVEAVMDKGRGRVVTIDPLGGGFEAGPALYLSVLGQFSDIPEICD
jgi:zinc transport system substrate-binding protein